MEWLPEREVPPVQTPVFAYFVSDSFAHQSVVRVNPAVGGALGGAMGWVPAPQHAAVVTLLAHTATTAAPGIATVVTVW